ncbi:MAG: suppressor of fused domain protein [Planctomycetaceae bacterium]
MFDLICRMAETPRQKPQPPFTMAPILCHPTAPVDYEAVRSEMFKDILGPVDLIFHPSKGAPHVDVERHPPSKDRPYVSFITNGMSDFPQVLPNGSMFRAELFCAAHEFSQDWPDLLNIMGVFPFKEDTFLHNYNTVPFPDGIGDPKFTYAATVPPYLEPRLANLEFLGARLYIFMVIRITDAERGFAVETSTVSLVNELPDVLDTWLIDGRRESLK